MCDIKKAIRKRRSYLKWHDFAKKLSGYYKDRYDMLLDIHKFIDDMGGFKYRHVSEREEESLKLVIEDAKKYHKKYKNKKIKLEKQRIEKYL